MKGTSFFFALGGSTHVFVGWTDKYIHNELWRNIGCFVYIIKLPFVTGISHLVVSTQFKTASQIGVKIKDIWISLSTAQVFSGNKTP